jgi:hypothetical protein
MPTTLARPEAAPWPAERAAEWQRRRGWRVGCNFIPSHASNALEMWQEASFDEGAIERELGLAAGIGFNSVRVFLHDLLWTHERAGFLARLERFLGIAARQGIGALLVFFDGVWNPHPQPGPQPEPRPRVHNAGWVQSPGAALLGEPARHASLRPYLQGVIDRFRDDPRIDGWDLFNEPDNPNPAYAAEEIANKDACALALTERAFTWAREVAPAQPITAGVWRGSFGEGELSALDRVMLESSDLISFHHYGPEAALAGRVAQLRRFGRPLVCTEWLARGMQSRFDPQLAWFREHEVDAYCWGLVAGRTQTQYGWDSWLKRYDAEPALWHHDVFRPDGTPFDPAEVAFIRSVTRA